MPVERFKTQRCKILHYDKGTGELDIDFLGFGIRLYGISTEEKDYINIRYRGEIGKPDFICRT